MAVGAAGGVVGDFAEIERFEKFACALPLRQPRFGQYLERFGVKQQQSEADHIARNAHNAALGIEHQRGDQTAKDVHRAAVDRRVHAKRAAVIVGAGVIGVAVHAVGALGREIRVLRYLRGCKRLCRCRFAVKRRTFLCHKRLTDGAAGRGKEHDERRKPGQHF